MKVVIEMPKGDTRRRHLKYDHTGFVDLGPIKDVIPVNDGIMPIHYGYIPETFNEKDNDEVDVIVFSEKNIAVGQVIDVRVIGLMRRADGDDKIIAVDETQPDVHSWIDIPKSTADLISSFFSYHHKILGIDDIHVAEEYLSRTRKKQFSPL